MPEATNPCSSDYYIYRMFESLPIDSCIVHPNIITTINLIFVTPMIVYFMLKKEINVVFGLCIFRHILDCLDGWVARTCNLQSKCGADYDVFSDNVYTILFLLVWLYQLTKTRSEKKYMCVFIVTLLLFVHLLSQKYSYPKKYAQIIHDNQLITTIMRLFVWKLSLP